MNLFYKSYLIFSILLWMVLNSYAQEDIGKSGEIADRQVVIVKDRQNTIDPAERITEKAILPDEPPSDREFNHSLSEPLVKLPPMDLHLSVNKVETPKLSKLYGNYVRGGYGNKQTSYLDGWFHTTRSKKLSLGASVHHLAGGHGDITDSKFSDNKIGLNTKHFVNKLKIETSVYYLRNRVNLYGSPHSVEDSIKKISNQGAIGLGFGNLPEKEDKLQWNGNININHYDNNFKISENGGDLSIWADYKMKETSRVKLRFLNNTGFQKDTSSVISQVNAIQPQYQYTTNQFSLTAGLKFAFYSDKDTSVNRLYPDVYFEWYALKERLSLLAAMNGTMNRDNFRTVNSENPFLGKINRLYYSEAPLNISAGLRFFLEEKLRFSSVYSISFNETQYLFYPVNTLYLVFYQDSIQTSKWKNNIDYQPFPNLQTSVEFSFIQYSLPEGDTVWFKPKMELGFNAKYNLGKKIYCGLDIFWLNGLKAPGISLDPITDINLNLEYRFSTRFSVFAEAFNVLSKNYKIYNYYKINGFTLIGGLSYTF